MLIVTFMRGFTWYSHYGFGMCQVNCPWMCSREPVVKKALGTICMDASIEADWKMDGCILVGMYDFAFQTQSIRHTLSTLLILNPQPL